MKRCFVAYFHFVGWDCLSVGFHICVEMPNLEIHVPFGFFRIGWAKRWPYQPSANRRAWGLLERIA